MCDMPIRLTGDQTENLFRKPDAIPHPNSCFLGLCQIQQARAPLGKNHYHSIKLFDFICRQPTVASQSLAKTLTRPPIKQQLVFA